MWQPEAFESPPSESKNRPHFTTVTCYGIDNVTFSVPRAIKTILKKNMTNFFFTPCERPAQKVNMDESHHKIFLKDAKVRKFSQESLVFKVLRQLQVKKIW